MNSLFNSIYKNKNVFVTGHTGFKGSWLMYWLQRMEANITGYALSPDTNPSHYNLLNPKINSIIANLSDREKLKEAVNDSKPEIVFHLAAQPYVGYSFENPTETYLSNVIGTLNLLEAARLNKNIKAIVIVTTDKVYKNKESVNGYIEKDRLGGYDPYSSSKACCELLVNSYRNSYFNLKEYKKTHNTLIGTARAGNVIGGGDWGMDRLIPDIVKNYSLNKSTFIRRPEAIRPWQHVLESLSGYLLLGQKLLEGRMKIEMSDAWNFGPKQGKDINVQQLVNLSKEFWAEIQVELNSSGKKLFHETTVLKLDSSKANNLLNWKPIWDGKKAIKYTIEWYKAFYKNREILTSRHIKEYVEQANKQKLIWTK